MSKIDEELNTPPRTPFHTNIKASIFCRYCQNNKNKHHILKGIGSKDIHAELKIKLPIFPKKNQYSNSKQNKQRKYWFPIATKHPHYIRMICSFSYNPLKSLSIYRLFVVEAILCSFEKWWWEDLYKKLWMKCLCINLKWGFLLGLPTTIN